MTSLKGRRFNRAKIIFIMSFSFGEIFLKFYIIIVYCYFTAFTKFKELAKKKTEKN